MNAIIIIIMKVYFTLEIRFKKADCFIQLIHLWKELFQILHKINFWTVCSSALCGCTMSVFALCHIRFSHSSFHVSVCLWWVYGAMCELWNWESCISVLFELRPGHNRVFLLGRVLHSCFLKGGILEWAVLEKVSASCQGCGTWAADHVVDTELIVRLLIHLFWVNVLKSSCFTVFSQSNLNDFCVWDILTFTACILLMLHSTFWHLLHAFYWCYTLPGD